MLQPGGREEAASGMPFGQNDPHYKHAPSHLLPSSHTSHPQTAVVKNKLRKSVADVPVRLSVVVVPGSNLIGHGSSCIRKAFSIAS